MLRSLLRRRRTVSRLSAASTRFSGTQECPDSKTAVRGASAAEDGEMSKKDDVLRERRTRDPRPFNRFAIMDLLVEKFDDDLLYLPEVLSNDEWMSLAERGISVEKSLKNINYGEILSTGKIDDAVRGKLSEMNLFRHKIPVEYGGCGYTETESKYLHEIVGQYPSVARALGENEDWGINAIALYGTEEQKRKYLPRLAAGETVIAAAYLEDSSCVFEPPSYFGTSANQSDSNFLLQGRKTWVNNATLADLLLVFGSTSVVDGAGVMVLNSLFLVDKKSDGVVVHKPKPKNWLKGFDICDVTFDETRVGPESVVGGFGKGLDVLRELYKTSKSHICSECSATMKKLVYDAIDKCHEGKFLDHGLKYRQFASLVLGELSCLAYAVESVTYYLASRTDYYLNPDLGIETLLARLFATETLPQALQMYFNLTGKEGYKSGTFLEEVVHNAHFYSVLDESTNNLKIFALEDCLTYAAKMLATQIKQHALKLDYPRENAKALIARNFNENDKPSYTLKLELCVHESLRGCARDLEYCVHRLAYLIERHLQVYKNRSMDHDYQLLLICDVFIQVYALTASLARASRAACLNLTNHAEDVYLARAFGALSANKVKHISNVIGRSSVEAYHKQEIGRKALNAKTYLAEHPLMRNF